MIIGVVKESFPGERRVALVPGVLPQLMRAGPEVILEPGAGLAAGFLDQDYTAKGAAIAADRAEVFAKADVVVQVRPPGSNPDRGHADLEASAECQAEASVRANIDAKCTEPELTVAWEADVVVDESKLKAAKAAIEAGLPRLLMVKAKIEGPVAAAFKTWGKAAKELKDASSKLVKSFGDQGMCIAGQVGAAFAMLASIQASIDIQVEVSVEASASAGVGG